MVCAQKRSGAAGDTFPRQQEGSGASCLFMSGVRVLLVSPCRNMMGDVRAVQSVFPPPPLWHQHPGNTDKK